MLKNLSKNDAITFLDFISHALNCEKVDAFQKLFSKLQNLIDFSDSVCGAGNLVEALISNEASYDFVPIRYPEEYLNRYITKGYHLLDPMFKEAVKTSEVQNWNEVNNKLFSGKKDVVYSDAEEFGLVDGFTYGISDSSNVNWTMFWFAGKQVENIARTKLIIRQAVPHLSEAMKRTLKNKKKNKYSLTPREIEVLNWLKEGKSSWEIGMILGISERGVNFHINNTKNKLDSNNRTQAVAIALSLGLIFL